MRVLIFGGPRKRLSEGLSHWAGHQWELHRHVFDQIVTFNQHTPDMIPEVDLAGVADFARHARTADAVMCESPEALLLSAEWRRLGLAPVPTLALAVGGFLRVDAMRRWFQLQGRSDPWPGLRDATWLSWFAGSTTQERHLRSQGVEPGRIFATRGCSEVLGLFSNDAERLFAGGREVDADLARGLPSGGVLLPGGGRRDHVTALRAVSRLPALTFHLVDELLPRKQHELRQAGVDHLSNLHWLEPVALERFIALVKRARVVVVCLQAGSGDGGHTTVAAAHRLGVPVVVTDVPGICDYVSDDLDARLVPPGDPAALAAAVEELWHDAALGERLTAAGRLREQERCATARTTVTDALEAACAGAGPSTGQSPCPRPEAPRVVPGRRTRTEPRYKSLHVWAGYACNNDCLFCCDSTGAGSVRLAPEVVRQMLVDNVALGTVVFTRHEPTLNPDLVEWVAWAAELGYTNVSVVTNGRRLATGDLAARLVAAGLNTVDISVHGHTAALHDRITRRAGSFDQAVAGIRAMVAQRVEHPLSIKLLTTVTGLNVAHLPDLADFAFGFEPDSYGLNAVFLSGAASEHADEVAVDYDRIIASFAACLRPGDHRDLSLSEIPPCRTHGRLPPAYLGVREDFHGVDVDDQGRALGPREALAPPGRGFAYRAACAGCGYRSRCDGVPEAYLERYGWEGFDPVPEEAVASLASEGTPDPPPFERAEVLRDLLTPPAGQWRLAALRVGPTDALVELEVGPPHDLKVALVITPRDDGQQAYRRTRRFNVAIRGRSTRRADCELADTAIGWLMKQERLQGR